MLYVLDVIDQAWTDGDCATRIQSNRPDPGARFSWTSQAVKPRYSVLSTGHGMIIIFSTEKSKTFKLLKVGVQIIYKIKIINIDTFIFKVPLRWHWFPSKCEHIKRKLMVKIYWSTFRWWKSFIILRLRLLKYDQMPSSYILGRCPCVATTHKLFDKMLMHNNHIKIKEHLYYSIKY
jgi:hypothetical protein